MSDEIKELVKRLRHYYRDLTSHGAEGDLVGDDVILSAADALEAMAGEVERLKEACKYDALNAGAIAEIRRACKEIMGDNVSFVDDDFARCLLTLKTERDRLKAALDEAVKWMDGCAVSGGYPKWHAKARKALGGDAS